MFRPYFEHTAKTLRFLGFGETNIIIAGGTSKPEHIEKQTAVPAEGKLLGVWLG